MEERILKDERLSLRISKEDKKKLRIFCIENGFKNISDFFMYCYNKEVAEKQ